MATSVQNLRCDPVGDTVGRGPCRRGAYTRQCVHTIVHRAESLLKVAPSFAKPKVSKQDTADAAQLAQAYAVTGDERFGKRARDYLLWFARVYPTLPTTRQQGRFADSTLREGPFAVDCAMAYDLVAAAPFVSAADRSKIERDLLRTMGWECGHKCGHRNSSNWRTWAMAIESVCGFAIGDRQLIEEAVNGAWDPERNAYLYGAVQQIAHSFFSDGIHWERSAGYTYYTLSAMQYVLIPAKNSGMDIWQAPIPGVLEPFPGCAPHEEFGPPGPRSIKYGLDALFYLSFQNGSYATINDSGRGKLHMAPIFLNAYVEYQDPKYAWLIRSSGDFEEKPTAWQVWQPKGKSEVSFEKKDVHDGVGAYRLKTGPGARVALVQDVGVDAEKPTVVTGWVKVVSMKGASAHIRVNPAGEGKAHFTERIKEPGDWRQVRVEIPAGPSRLRLHVFVEAGEGEAIWDAIAVENGERGDPTANGGFDLHGSDGRRLSFWDLVHAPADVPEGRFSLADDAKIGLTGRHENGCTLFPVGGFAVMRADPVDVQATALTLTYGPYGSGHDHPDRLHFSLYGLDDILMPDAGSWGYEDKMHLTWANQTIAHNTLTVDETAQRPQGTSDSIWASEARQDHRVSGDLALFHPGKALKVVRTRCDTAYPGVEMDRTLCLVGPYVLDVFRCRSRENHTYDLAFHGEGKLDTGGPLPGETPVRFTKRGYAHLKDVRRVGFESGVAKADFLCGEKKSVRMSAVSPGPGAELYLAQAPVKGSGERSTVFVRQRGRDAIFVSVLEPHRGGPEATGVAVRRESQALVVEVERVEGIDRFTLEDALSGSVSLERQDKAGKKVAGETARP